MITESICRTLAQRLEREDVTLNPLSPRDALQNHITSLKTYLIFLHLGV